MGHPVDDDVKFCPECGQSVSALLEQPSENPPQPVAPVEDVAADRSMDGWWVRTSTAAKVGVIAVVGLVLCLGVAVLVLNGSSASADPRWKDHAEAVSDECGFDVKAFPGEVWQQPPTANEGDLIVLREEYGQPGGKRRGQYIESVTLDADGMVAEFHDTEIQCDTHVPLNVSPELQRQIDRLPAVARRSWRPVGDPRDSPGLRAAAVCGVQSPALAGERRDGSEVWAYGSGKMMLALSTGFQDERWPVCDYVPFRNATFCRSLRKPTDLELCESGDQPDQSAATKTTTTSTPEMSSTTAAPSAAAEPDVRQSLSREDVARRLKEAWEEDDRASAALFGDEEAIESLWQQFATPAERSGFVFEGCREPDDGTEPLCEFVKKDDYGGGVFVQFAMSRSGSGWNIFAVYFGLDEGAPPDE